MKDAHLWTLLRPLEEILLLECRAHQDHHRHLDTRPSHGPCRWYSHRCASFYSSARGSTNQARLHVQMNLSQQAHFRDHGPANKPKSHQPAPKIDRTTGRDKPVVGRSICLVGQAEQSACYGIKSAAPEAVMYDTDIYWEKGGGSRKVSDREPFVSGAAC